MTQPRSISFVGTMNALPMAYALKFKKMGWDVTYFVDVPRKDTLSRPEYKFPTIGYPYPDWIIERPVRSLMLATIMPQLFLGDIVRTLRKADVVVLSGLYLCLKEHLRKDQKVFFLSHGSDLNSWCDIESIEKLSSLFSSRIGKPLARLVASNAVHKMVRSLKSVNAIVSFPPGVSSSGDKVRDRELRGTDVVHIQRYDISFDDLPQISGANSPATGNLLKIICGTRHTFRPHPGLAANENKGTDIIIRALGQFKRSSGIPLEIHFFEKGLDLEMAKSLCRSEGIETDVIWHPQMPFGEFLKLHQECHIAFDQVGPHLIGLGMYAMYIGMPVIANYRADILDTFWGSTPPICKAENEADIVKWLTILADPQKRLEIGHLSQQYAIENFDCERAVRTMDALTRE